MALSHCVGVVLPLFLYSSVLLCWCGTLEDASMRGTTSCVGVARIDLFPFPRGDPFTLIDLHRLRCWDV